MNLTVSKMEPEDVPAVAALERQIFSVPWSAQSFLSAIASSDTLYLTAKVQDKIVGYCGFWQSFDEADITNVAVSPGCRGRGVGFRMVEELMEMGRGRGVERYTLEVRAGNGAAHRLYEKLGFYPVGIRKNFYEKPREDAVIMWTE